MLIRLDQQTTARIRVLDRGGWLLADTSRLGPRRDPDEVEEPTFAKDPRERWLYWMGSSLFRLWDRFAGEPPATVSRDYYAADRPFQGGEIEQALGGEYGAATRITPGGQRSVTLFSALPVVNEGAVVGVVLVSQSTYNILQDLYEVRIVIFEVVLAAVAVAAVLSLLLSTTISRPLKRLRSQAMALVDRRGRLKGRFRKARRLDEIGDLTRALAGLSDRLEERMKFIEEFAAAVSHEFKNPLTSIRAAAEMLAEAETPEERARFLKVVQGDIARLETLLSAVREITRLDAPADEGEPLEELVLNEIVSRVANAERYRARDVRVDVSLPDTPVTIEADGERLVRVFENLIDNAVGFSPPGGRVLVRLFAEGSRAVVQVEDEGPGIPQEHRQRIFQRFFSYRPEDAKAREHSGLGLAIVKSILERDGGTITVGEADAGGARFEVRLELQPA